MARRRQSLAGLTLLAFSALVCAADSGSPSVEDEILHNEHAEKVRVTEQHHLPGGTVLLDAEVTKKQTYLLVGEDKIPIRLWDPWKIDSDQTVIVAAFDNGLVVYDLKARLQRPIRTQLPVKDILEVTALPKAVVKVRLVDRSIEVYPLKDSDGNSR